MTNSSTGPIAFYGHHKCASSWFREILILASDWIGRRSAVFDNPRQFSGDLAATIEKQRLSIIAFTNAEISHILPLGEHRSVHLIRDPRDVIVSAYFSHRNSHATEGWPELVPHRKALQALSKEKGILAEIAFSECYLRQLSDWNYELPGVLEMRFEEVTTRPYEAFLEAFQHLQLLDEDDLTTRSLYSDFWRAFHQSVNRRLRGRWPLRLRRETIPAYQLLYFVHSRRFSRLAGGRKKGAEDSRSHYRKGVAGDWKNHFTDEIREAFEARYPTILEKTGYGWE